MKYPEEMQMTADFIDWKKIRYLILDVDGTMTDGGVYLDSQGNELKNFLSKTVQGSSWPGREGYRL